MSSRLPGILFILVFVVAIAGLGYYFVSGFGNYEVGAENESAQLAALTTIPTPLPTVSPTKTVVIMAPSERAPSAAITFTTSPTIALPVNGPPITLSADEGVNIERFSIQSPGEVTIVVTHTSSYTQRMAICKEHSSWILAGSTINDITLDNQETLKTTTKTVTLPVAGQYSITGISCYSWTATISNA